jgi:hypothetical protein
MRTLLFELSCAWSLPFKNGAAPAHALRPFVSLAKLTPERFRRMAVRRHDILGWQPPEPASALLTHSMMDFHEVMVRAPVRLEVAP